MTNRTILDYLLLRQQPFILLLIIGLLHTHTSAQVWERTTSGPNNLAWSFPMTTGWDVQPTTDGGYVMAGIQSYPTGAPRDYPFLFKVNANGYTEWEQSYFSDNGNVAFFSKVALEVLPNDHLLLVGTDHQTLFLIETDAMGDTVWTQSYSSQAVGGQEYINALNLILTDDGNYAISLGITDYISTTFYTQLFKINPTGTVLWTKVVGTMYAESAIQTLDGGYLLGGHYNNVPALFQLDNNADSSWVVPYNGQPMSSIHSVVQAPDSGFVFAVELQGFVGPTPTVMKVDPTGNTTAWSVLNIGQSVNGLLGKANNLAYDPNGYYVVTGALDVPNPAIFPSPTAVYTTLIDLTGTIVEEWRIDSVVSEGHRVRPTLDNGYILTGKLPQSAAGAYLAKFDSLLQFPVHRIQGTIYQDQNINCNKDAGEAGLNNWIIAVESNGVTNYTTTDSTGFYTIDIDTGTVVVKAILQNGLWAFCVDSATVNSTAMFNQDTIDFGAQALANCPFLQVDISAPFLRRCSTSYYTISYCNTGTADAQNAYVDVILDTTLTYQAFAQVPPPTINGNTYTFNLGTIPAGSCGSFMIEVGVSCYALLGAIHCAQANIYPDTNCIINSPLWDQSDIDVDGICYGDSIVYKIKNIGAGNMAVPRQYIVTEDHVMLLSNPFQLNAGDSIVEVVYTNGGVYRLEAEQDPNHPYSRYSALGIQMCVGFGSAISTPNSILVQYAEDDGKPTVSIDCQQNIGSWDPNDKRVYPIGYGANHAIYATTDLEYHIRFQNTGTDTAFKVVIMDTLSTHLDPTSIVLGASSHPYHWELKAGGILVVTFDQIMLPDSNVNEPASHGFVKFKIKQRPNNPLNTVINNTAAIYFDWNAPVITNTVFNTVDEDFIVAVKKIDKKSNLIIQAYPNPFDNQTTIKVTGANYEQLAIRVVDVAGREVQVESVERQSSITIHRRGMDTGVYFFQILADGVLIGTGKIIAQ